jgi:hypothetical protein
LTNVNKKDGECTLNIKWVIELPVVDFTLSLRLDMYFRYRKQLHGSISSQR